MASVFALRRAVAFLLLISFCLLLLAPSAYSQSPQPNSTDVAAGGKNTTITLSPSLPDSEVPRGQLRTDAASIITLIVLGVVGLAYCFFGFSLFHPTLFLTGFFFAANITLMALEKSDAFSNSGYSPTTLRLIYLSISLAVGFVGGWLLVCCWGVGVYVIGILGGLFLANLLMSMITVHLALFVRIIIMVVLAIVGAVLIHWFERPIIIGATSIAGAYITVFGIDMVVNKGIAYDYQHDVAPTMDSLWEVLGALGLAVIGVVVQSLRTSGSFGGHARQPVQQPTKNPYAKNP